MIAFIPFPEIRTSRLLLREMSNIDLDRFFMLRSNEEVMKYIERPRAKSKDDVLNLFQVIREGLEKNEAITWAISMENAGLIGTIGYWRIEKENGRAEIGYLLDPAYQGNGLMREALDAILDFGFNKLNLHSIVANVNPKNQASIRLLEKNNFVKEGLLRENFYFNGDYVDTLIFTRLHPDPFHRHDQQPDKGNN